MAQMTYKPNGKRNLIRKVAFQIISNYEKAEKHCQEWNAAHPGENAKPAVALVDVFFHCAKDYVNKMEWCSERQGRDVIIQALKTAHTFSENAQFKTWAAEMQQAVVNGEKDL